MDETDHTAPGDTPPPPPVTPRRGNGCLIAFMLIAGITLLLPGICGFLFSSGGQSNPLAELGIMIGTVGIMLIAAALLLIGAALFR